MSSQRTHFQKGVCIRACARKSTAVATVETVGPTGVETRGPATVQEAWKRSRGPNAVQKWVLATPCKHKKMICKLLIPAPWHGRGQRFEPVQVHQPHLLALRQSIGCPPQRSRTRSPNSGQTCSVPLRSSYPSNSDPAHLTGLIPGQLVSAVTVVTVSWRARLPGNITATLITHLGSALQEQNFLLGRDRAWQSIDIF